MAGRLQRRLRALLRRKQLERELDDELQHHLEREAEQHVARGLSLDEARAAALKSFGGVTQAKEACRDARGVRVFEELWHDLRYGVRMLRKQPGFTAIAVITLALGIGANTAIFTVVNAVLLKALPFPDSDRLVVINEGTQAQPELAVAYPDYLDWRAQQTVFEDLAASLVTGGVLTGGGEPERVFGRRASASFFTTLGVAPHVGRVFNEAEDRLGGARVVVLSHALWQRRYGGDPQLIGRAVNYNGESYTVVGVLPANFDYYGQANANNDLFLPLGQMTGEPYMQKRDSHPNLRVVARMKQGVTVERARVEMQAIAARLATQYPATNVGVGVTLRSLLDDYVGDVRLTLWVLLGAVVLVLLIACANVANLLLARAAVRRREIAVRLALGAGRGRVVRQLLTESLLISLVGGACGALLAAWGVSLLTRFSPDDFPRLEDVRLDWRVLGFTLFVTALTGIVFGLAPALQTARVELQTALKAGGRNLTGGGQGLRGAFVVIEIALSLTLLVGAGLLLRSFHRLMQVDPGYDPQNVLTLRVRLPDARYRERAQVLGFLQQVLPRIAALPGVERACLTTGVPLGRSDEDEFVIAGQPEPAKEQMPVALKQWVSADYHKTFGITLLAGRYLSARDTADVSPVVLVDEDLARKYFPQLAAGAVVGQRLKFTGEGEQWREIVGVVRHIRHEALDEQPRVQVYGPYEQMNPRWLVEVGRAMDVGVKSSVEQRALVEAIRREVQALDPELPLSHIRTLNEALALSVAPRRFNLALLGVFAVVALLLCVVGIYGVMSYTVTQRTPEIGIRLALGAQPRDVRRLVLRQGLRLAFIGLAIGLVGAWVLTRLLQSLLYGVSPSDPLTFGCVALLLTSVALLASYIPARRAMKVDPLIALRYE